MMVRLTQTEMGWSQGEDTELRKRDIYVNEQHVEAIELIRELWPDREGKKSVYERTCLRMVGGGRYFVDGSPKEIADRLMGRPPVTERPVCGKTLETFGKTHECVLVEGHEGDCRFGAARRKAEEFTFPVRRQ